MKNRKDPKNKTISVELKGRTWRTPEPNVMYSVHCTVQYHAGAINEDRAGFPAVTTEMNTGNSEREDKLIDTGTEKNLMADVLKTKVNDRNCMGTHLTPHLKYYSNMLDKSQTADDFDFNDFEHTHVAFRDSLDSDQSSACFPSENFHSRKYLSSDLPSKR